MDITPGGKRTPNDVQRVAGPAAPHSAVAKKRRFTPARIIVAAVIIILLVIIGWMWYTNNYVRGQRVDTKEYQAVFLTNGQVYFGKLQNAQGNYLQLTDIFYLQASQPIQPGDKNAAPANTSDSNNVQLIKLGNELHGPEDSMAISKDQVLFWENLKPSGKVSQAINNYKP